jgi:hypothetical protein
MSSCLFSAKYRAFCTHAALAQSETIDPISTSKTEHALPEGSGKTGESFIDRRSRQEIDDKILNENTLKFNFLVYAGGQGIIESCGKRSDIKREAPGPAIFIPLFCLKYYFPEIQVLICLMALKRSLTLHGKITLILHKSECKS